MSLNLMFLLVSFQAHFMKYHTYLGSTKCYLSAHSNADVLFSFYEIIGQINKLFFITKFSKSGSTSIYFMANYTFAF